MAGLLAWVKQQQLPGAILVLACFAGGPALASIVPSTVPPAAEAPPAAPAPAPVATPAPAAAAPA